MNNWNDYNYQVNTINDDISISFVNNNIKINDFDEEISRDVFENLNAENSDNFNTSQRTDASNNEENSNKKHLITKKMSLFTVTHKAIDREIIVYIHKTKLPEDTKKEIAKSFEYSNKFIEKIKNELEDPKNRKKFIKNEMNYVISSKK